MKSIKSLLKPQKKSRSKGLKLFVHIPKTAGTSFRVSLSEKEPVIMDYGHENEHTSEIVEHLVYSENDIFKFGQHIKQSRAWVSGHFGLKKYAGLVELQNIVTFIREPVQRVISHYHHNQRWSQLDMTLTEFLHSSSANNIQTRYLQSIPLSLIGVVGITEKYSDSLKIINHQFGTKLLEKYENQNEQKKPNNVSFNQETIKWIEKQNELDIALYKKAQANQAERLNFLALGKAWTYMHATLSKNYVVNGIAFRNNDNKPIHLYFEVDNKVVYECKASEYVSLYPNIKLPRNRYVGFRFKLPKAIRNETSRIYCADTGQSIETPTRKGY